MSNRNNLANKRAATERMRAERERQQKRDKTRRQLIVGGAIVAVLAIAAGVGVAVSNLSGGNGTSKVSAADWTAAAKKKPFKAPANSTGTKGTTVVIGQKNAKNTLEVFEDPRCPVCASFEQASGEMVLKDMKAGKYKLSFTMGTFLDNNLKGSGSKNALSAMGAALNVSPDAFLEFKKALYSVKNHPKETDDAFSSDAKLIEIAQQVPALKGNKAFEKDVTGGTYDQWALAMSEKFNGVKDITGTPSFKLNGKKMVVEGAPEGTPIITPQQFNAAYQKALAAK